MSDELFPYAALLFPTDLKREEICCDNDNWAEQCQVCNNTSIYICIGDTSLDPDNLESKRADGGQHRRQVVEIFDAEYY